MLIDLFSKHSESVFLELNARELFFINSEPQAPSTSFSIIQRKSQRDKYLKKLDDIIRLLARHPGIGCDAEDIKQGYKKLSEGSRIIFYRAGTESKIIVTRILPESMNVGHHL